ncbi:WYL domain-containing transcriptional regulator [Cryobacterium adonitolivorans]|uniref:WYL domain-containing transcriptional regulator n=1 Tax=Cryobacterium adonitolivorans TaxID=1259189 RepID=A0A4R8VZX5_9MICO|nr:WYL domain-containing protein [Cryobacterium adonitolivorans]TFB97499.1 WYL domain-containing transcriptional regulator [Cryobacterium adonitolivorans]
MTPTTSRLLLLLSLLQTRRDWPGALLADRLQISHRTVRRDVDRLREMGYSIHAMKGPDGGYRLDAGSELPPLLFDDDQVIALTVALQAATVTGAGIEEAALRALTTMRQVMPSRLRHRLDALQFTALPARSGDAVTDPVFPDVLIALSAAIRAREVLRFDYASRRPVDHTTLPIPPRRVEPHHLVTSSGRWYLVGWDLELDGWRIFRADRVAPRIPAGPRFTPREVPGGNVRDYVSARFKGSAQVNTWPCRGTVILGLPASAVLPFAGDGIVEDLGPDRCRYEVGSWSWVALAASLGRFDSTIEVVGPPELSAAFGHLAERYAATASTAQPPS